MSKITVTTFRLDPKTINAIAELKTLNVTDIYGKNKYKSLNRILIHICIYTKNKANHIQANHIQEITANRSRHGIEKSWLSVFNTTCKFLNRSRDIALNNAILDILHTEKQNEKLRLFKRQDELSKLES